MVEINTITDFTQVGNKRVVEKIAWNSPDTPGCHVNEKGTTNGKKWNHLTKETDSIKLNPTKFDA